MTIESIRRISCDNHCGFRTNIPPNETDIEYFKRVKWTVNGYGEFCSVQCWNEFKEKKGI